MYVFIKYMGISKFGGHFEGLFIFSNEVLGGAVVLAGTTERSILLWIFFVVHDGVTCPPKVRLYALLSLSLIESNLYSCLALAGTGQVIMLYLRRDYVLHAGNLLYGGLVALCWQAAQIKIDHCGFL